MTHWGWYWKVKIKHIPKALCDWTMIFSTIDSFSLFKNRTAVALVHASADRLSFEIPRYDLRAYLLPDNGLQIIYSGGEYLIPIERKSCNYGGFYHFFRCPQCDVRMRKLYCSEGRYLCRKCLKLGYYTQRLRPSRRNLMMYVDIKDKLTQRFGSLEKRPIRMHTKTYYDFLRRYLAYHEQWYEESVREARAWYGAKVEPFIDGYFQPFFIPDSVPEASGK